MNTLRDALNRANPNSLPPENNLIGMGNVVNMVPKTVRGAVTANILTLPEAQKAGVALSIYGIGGASGYMTILAVGDPATPAAGQAKVTATGNIEFAAADAITAALVVYLSPDAEVYEEEIDVVSDLGTLLASRRMQTLLEAEALVGTATGVKTPVFRPATPAAGQAAIAAGNDAQVEFANADGVTRARVKYLAIPGEGSTARPTVSTGLATEYTGIV